MDTLEKVSLRLEVLRTALEFGTQRDILEPDKLFDKYWEIVMQGSEEARPKDNRKDDSRWVLVFVMRCVLKMLLEKMLSLTKLA